jgi:hypothetical protein
VGFVGADSLEDTEPVMEGVAQDVNLSIVPIDELPVEPNFFSSNFRGTHLTGSPRIHIMKLTFNDAHSVFAWFSIQLLPF